LFFVPYGILAVWRQWNELLFGKASPFMTI